MLGLLVLSLLTQADDSVDEFLRPRRVERVSRASGRSGPGFAFFEAFPANGRGSGAACPLPNWALQSEDFSNVSWTLNSGVVAVPTVTANFSTDPLGGNTADRIQYPATTPPTQYSRVFQNGVVIPAGPIVCSVYLKGNGTSGTLPLYLLTTFPSAKSICSFSADSWTRCSVSVTNTTGSENFYIGPSGAAGDGSFPALDVLAWGAMCNVGSTAAPYVRTTTVAATSMPSGAKGEQLTFSRTGNAYCTIEGLATTGLTNSSMVLMPGDASRVELDSNGTLGLLVESARTNSLLRSQEFDTAAVWVPANAGASSAPVVTANQATAPDGTLTADQIAFPSVTAAGTDVSIVRQTITATAAAWSFSVYLRRASGTSTVYLAAYDNSLVYAGATACTVVSTSWTRCTLENKTLNAAIWYVTIGVDLRTGSGQSAQSAQTIYAWGAQGESPATYVSSYIQTTGATATRNAETTSFGSVTGLDVVSAGSSAATVTVPWTGSGGVGGFTYASGTGRYLHANGTTVRSFDGTTEVQIAHSMTANTSKRFASSWSGSTQTVFNVTDSTSSSGAFDGSMTSGTLSVGYSATNAQIDGIISRVCLDPSPTRCR